ncbi:glycosyl hydrolase family 95 catalytic domain-containing protein [Nonomuraea helvata]|uniref:Glycoside hydrolase N-terminal domain-containing protein n=1 Tax=Nonomuraea helvata TaxID=37484 RepID=A0ABV5SE97_9ACTN
MHSLLDLSPALTWENAFLSGNGEVGIMVYGDPREERVVVNHHRFVLPNGTRDRRPPAVAHLLPEIRSLLLAGRPAEAQALAADGRSLEWTQPFHPGWELVISRPASSGEYRRTTDFATGEVTTCSHWAFVSRADAVVVQRLTGDVTLRLTGDLPGRPETVRYETAAGEQDGQVFLRIRGAYPPEGRGAAGFEGLTLVRPRGGTVVVEGDTVTVTGAAEVLLLTQAARHDESPTEPLPAADLADLAELGYDSLLSRHVALHRPLYERVTLDLGATPDERARPVGELAGAALVERIFHAGRYLLLSSSGILPPRLTGLWLGAWGAAWSGDFTTDANLNLQMAGVNIGALPELIDGYANLIRGQIDHWRTNARQIYGARGILAPSRTDGENGHLFHLNADWPWTMWLAGADWLLYPLVEHAETTGEPVPELEGWLAECRLFWEDFLAGTDGSVVPSFSPEVGPGGGPLACVNATMDVAAARHALGDSPVSGRLAPYRIDDRGALAEWIADVPPYEDHRHVSHLYPVWPLHEINPDDTPELAAAARQALLLRGDENLSAHGSLHRALAAARLKDGELAWANVRKILDNGMFFDSLMSSHNPGREIYNADAAISLPGVLLELLVHSRPGVVELLPALPSALGRGRVTGVRCRGRVTVEELTWGDGVRARLTSPVGQTVTVIHRASGLRREVELPAGKSVEIA